MSLVDSGERLRPQALALCVLTALTVARSAVFVWWPQSQFDADQAVTGLMAKHVSELRAFPVFWYGQTYILGVESWLAAPLFAAFGLLLSLPHLRRGVVDRGLPRRTLRADRLLHDALRGALGARYRGDGGMVSADRTIAAAAGRVGILLRGGARDLGNRPRTADRRVCDECPGRSEAGIDSGTRRARDRDFKPPITRISQISRIRSRATENTDNTDNTDTKPYRAAAANILNEAAASWASLRAALRAAGGRPRRRLLAAFKRSVFVRVIRG